MLLIILTIGFFALLVYGKICGFTLQNLLKMALSGIRPAKNIVFVMLLVGALTALWRAGGTIAAIVSLASGALIPSIFLPSVFLLCAIVSVLTGTSIGTAATMGVISMSVGNAMGISPAIVGGSALAGAYLGDRSSPVSTSAILVSEVTKTNLYDNLKAMVRTAIIPFVISILLYGIIGTILLNMGPSESGCGVSPIPIADLFKKHFHLSWITFLPAIAILALSIFRINVKWTMLTSIAISAGICVNIQGFSIAETLKFAFWGYEAPAEIKTMMSGGGIFKMIPMLCTVLISMTYAGIFKGTNTLRHVYAFAEKTAQKIRPFGCTILTATLTGMLCCNQTISIVLTNDICQKIIPDAAKRALYIENSAVIIAPLIPWSVASLIPLGMMEAPTNSILFAFYLFLIPLVNLFLNQHDSHQKQHNDRERRQHAD
ncbi:MAG: hypothetical protein J6Z31_06865 [Fibrobacter sp.]|nr:hypothetical protein [Fibrobacter sp.]